MNTTTARIGIKQTVNVIVGFGGGYDKYHQNKFSCAVTLDRDNCGEWVYVTQWMSGTCLFVNPYGDQYVSVNPHTGKMKFTMVVKQ
jgi:signal transduction histidine kinase